MEAVERGSHRAPSGPVAGLAGPSDREIIDLARLAAPRFGSSLILISARPLLEWLGEPAASLVGLLLALCAQSRLHGVG